MLIQKGLAFADESGDLDTRLKALRIAQSVLASGLTVGSMMATADRAKVYLDRYDIKW